MTSLFARRGRALIRSLVRSAILLTAAVGAPVHGAEMITVAIDQAATTHMPPLASTLVIGNPLIADVTVLPGGILVVTGKGYGTTNLIALDHSGAVLSESNIQVIGPEDQIVYVYRGLNRESYSCRPNCEPRITLGDSSSYFGDTLAQSGNRTARAQAAATAAGQGQAAAAAGGQGQAGAVAPGQGRPITTVTPP